eukprot:scaffold147728_cov27-Tisochrysis_lutea.AAC.1
MEGSVPPPLLRRPSEVQRLLRDGVLRSSRTSAHSRSEFDRLRETLRSLRAEGGDGWGGGSSEGGEAVRALAERVRALHRAIETVSTTLETEAAALRAADSGREEAIRRLADGVSDADGLRAEVADVRRDLKAALAQMRAIEKDRGLTAELDTLHAEVGALRAALAEERSSAAQERKRLAEELKALRIWRADAVEPFVDTAERSRVAQREALDVVLPQALDRIARLEAHVAAAASLPEQVVETRRSVQAVGESVEALGGQLRQLTEVHNYSVGSLEADVGRARDEAQAKAAELEGHLQVAAAELEQVCACHLVPSAAALASAPPLARPGPPARRPAAYAVHARSHAVGS